MKAKRTFSGGLIILYFILGICIIGNKLKSGLDFISRV